MIELASDYTVPSQSVQVQGRQNNQWVVQLPSPTQTSAAGATGGTIQSTTTANRVSGGNSETGASAVLSGVVTTGDGFLIKLSGNAPEPEVEISGGRPR